MGDPKRSTKQICNWRFGGALGRGGYGLCDINFGMGNLVGGAIGQARWGGRLGHGDKFVFFYVAILFFWMRGRGGGKNKVGPKKVQSNFELIDRVCLARGTLTNKWCGLK